MAQRHPQQLQRRQPFAGKSYIDRSQDDDTEKLRLNLLRSATHGANDARHAAGASGTQTIGFTSYSDKQ
jgi:hypothetical protein